MSAPAGSSTVKLRPPPGRWFCQFVALPGEPRAVQERQPCSARVATAGRRAAAVGPDEIQVLVEPDRRARVDPRGSARGRAGVSGSENGRRRSSRSSPGGPIGRHPAGKFRFRSTPCAFCARAARDAVRVERRHEPEILVRMGAAQRARRRPCPAHSFPWMHRRRGRAARPRHVHDLDRPVLHRMADDARGR